MCISSRTALFFASDLLTVREHRCVESLEELCRLHGRLCAFVKGLAAAYGDAANATRLLSYLHQEATRHCEAMLGRRLAFDVNGEFYTEKRFFESAETPSRNVAFPCVFVRKTCVFHPFSCISGHFPGVFLVFAAALWPLLLRGGGLADLHRLPRPAECHRALAHGGPWPHLRHSALDFDGFPLDFHWIFTGFSLISMGFEAVYDRLRAVSSPKRVDLRPSAC